MIPTPMPAYFLIKIPKKLQQERREKVGSLFIHHQHVHMTRELQNGEIVFVGSDAHRHFPEAKIGHTLLIHHFVSGKEGENEDGGRYRIYEDETFNYYTVTSFSFSGRSNECYAVFDGKEIITHPDYIFLATEKKEGPAPADQFINQNTTTSSGGIVIFKQWGEPRESITEKNKKIKARIESLANIGDMSDEIKNEIYTLEQEMVVNSRKSNKKKYEPYRVAAANPAINEWFNWPVKAGDVLYCLNIATQTTIDFLGVEYRVVKINFIAAPYGYLKQAIEKYKLKTA